MRLRNLMIPAALLTAAVIGRRRVHAAHLKRLAGIGSVIRLKDGRILGYAEYGDPHGRPVVFLHGSAGSRLAGRAYHETAARLGVRLIAPERPGYGFSTPQPDRTLLGWADDLAALADALGVERFALFGLSGGGPHAAACAYRIPERLTAVGLVASPAPPGNPGQYAGMQTLVFLMSRVGRVWPWLAGVIGRAFNWPLLLLPDQARRQALNMYPEHADLVPKILDTFIDDTREAFRSGVLGMGTDFVSARPWGFRLSDITGVPVYLWHGEADTNVPPAMGRYLAGAIPGCRATFYPGEDHLLTGLTHGEEILSALLGAQS